MLPLRTTSGPKAFVSPENAVWVAPSIVMPPLTSGSGERGLIVNTFPSNPGSDAGMLKKIVCGVAPFAFASRIACRSEPAPLSKVLVTVQVTAHTSLISPASRTVRAWMNCLSNVVWYRNIYFSLVSLTPGAIYFVWHSAFRTDVENVGRLFWFGCGHRA